MPAATYSEKLWRGKQANGVTDYDLISVQF